MSFKVSKRTAASLCLCLLGASFLSGCSASFTPDSTPSAADKSPIGEIQGSVHGGQAPITGAWIYLFAAGTGGYGTAATSLITSGGPTVSCPSSATPAPANSSTYPILNTACFTQTDSNGNFALAGDYSCTAGQQVYMVAVGGNPGATASPVTTTATYSANSSTITVASATGINPGMTVAGSGVAGSVTAVSGTTVTLSQQTTSASPAPGTVTFAVTTTATYANKSTTITVASATGITTGMTVTGSGVGGTVTAVSGTTVTLSQKTSSAGTGASVTFSVATTASYAANGPTIIVASATGITTGVTVTGSGAGGTVTNVNGTTVTLSQNTTAASGAFVAFSGVNNTAIIQMAALGQCPSAGNLAAQVPFLVINEVSTVAFAYSVRSFATTPFNVSTSSTGTTGLANAFANATNIVNIGNGQAPTAAIGNLNSTNPQGKLYSLANILATCVNQVSSTSSLCTNLFNDATTSAGTAATDEASAIFNIVHNPTQNVTSIYNLGPAAGVFGPTLSGPPTDWTLPVIYNNVIGQPTATAIDGSGKVWISDGTKNAVVMLSAQGTMSSFTNGGSFGSMGGVAVNPVTGKIWASDSTNNKVFILDSTGSVLTTITTGTLNKPAGIAFDRLGNGYVVNSGAYVIDEYTSAGGLVQTSTYPSTQGYATTIAVDYSGDVYTGAGAGQSGVGALLAGATAGQFFSHSDSAGPIALDATQNTALATTQYNTTQPNDIWSISSSSGLGWRYNFYTQGYTFGGVYNNTYIGQLGGMKPGTSPSSLAFDGAGNLWIAEGTPTANSTYPLTGFNVSSSYGLTAMAANGFATGAASGVGAYTAVPDNAGNVWVLNKDGSVSQMLGIATPIVTPTVPGKFATVP